MAREDTAEASWKANGGFALQGRPNFCTMTHSSPYTFHTPVINHDGGDGMAGTRAYPQR